MELVALKAAFEEMARFAPLQCVLVSRSGDLIGEYYAYESVKSTAINIHSVSKSILSLLVGIALRERWLTDIHQPIADWLPEYFDASIDGRKKSITLRHLLTMSAGLGWIENPASIRRLWQSSDWIAQVIGLPLVAIPGRQFAYNTGLTHLLSVILSRASGMSTRMLAESYLFGPLGIELADWKTDSQGYHIGGTDVYITPRNMLTLGQYLSNANAKSYLLPGASGDRGSVSHAPMGSKAMVLDAWLHESMKAQIELRQPGFWHPAYRHYGYLWWLRKLQSYDAVVASGYAGQLIITIRKLGLVVVTTADDTIPFTEVMKQSNQIEGMVEDLIIPAVREE